jgi:FkbM family methyltransferase
MRLMSLAKFASSGIKPLGLYGVRLGLKLPSGLVNRYSELEHLKSLLERLEIGCVLDVGANQGQFAHELRDIGYKGWIVSFEPVRSQFDILTRSFAGDDRWRGYHLALGRETKPVEINVFPSTVFSSLLPMSAKTRETPHRETTQMTRLDAIFHEVTVLSGEARTFLKMDTQGFDVEVFAGATDCLSRIWGLQSELSVNELYQGQPRYLDALRVYEDAGYALTNLSIVNRIHNGDIQELNCFMQRRGAG